MIESRRMGEAFVEERRTALERYLNRLAAHPAAARSEVRARHLSVREHALHSSLFHVNCNPQLVCKTPQLALLLRLLLFCICCTASGGSHRCSCNDCCCYCAFQALRVFLEADGNLRSNPQWRCLKPSVLTPIQATNRLLRTLVGARKTAPTPSEVVQPAAACRDVYRLLHENIQQMRGSFKHSPLGAEVRLRLANCAACMWFGASAVPGNAACCRTAELATALSICCRCMRMFSATVQPAFSCPLVLQHCSL
jgi:hypothetical protein